MLLTKIDKIIQKKLLTLDVSNNTYEDLSYIFTNFLSGKMPDRQLQRYLKSLCFTPNQIKTIVPIIESIVSCEVLYIDKASSSKKELKETRNKEKDFWVVLVAEFNENEKIVLKRINTKDDD